VTYDYTECKENTVSSATPRQCSAVLTDNPGLPKIRAKTEIMGGGINSVKHLEMKDVG